MTILSALRVISLCKISFDDKCIEINSNFVKIISDFNCIFYEHRMEVLNFMRRVGAGLLEKEHRLEFESLFFHKCNMLIRNEKVPIIHLNAQSERKNNYILTERTFWLDVKSDFQFIGKNAIWYWISPIRFSDNKMKISMICLTNNRKKFYYRHYQNFYEIGTEEIKINKKIYRRL